MLFYYEKWGNKKVEHYGRRVDIMAHYKMTINTDTYKCGRYSKKNWEPGTRNDYMIAINGITRTLYSMREVVWQLELFKGNRFLHSEWVEEKGDWSDKYLKFVQKNLIKYYDKLCGFEREQYYISCFKPDNSSSVYSSISISKFLLLILDINSIILLIFLFLLDLLIIKNK